MRLFFPSSFCELDAKSHLYFEHKTNGKKNEADKRMKRFVCNGKSYHLRHSASKIPNTERILYGKLYVALFPVGKLYKVRIKVITRWLRIFVSNYLNKMNLKSNRYFWNDSFSFLQQVFSKRDFYLHFTEIISLHTCFQYLILNHKSICWCYLISRENKNTHKKFSCHSFKVIKKKYLRLKSHKIY